MGGDRRPRGVRAPARALAPPRRWVRYDGAPEDFLVGVALALPALATLDGPARWAVGALVVVSGGTPSGGGCSSTPASAPSRPSPSRCSRSSPRR
ncbi:hypothetical protein [Halobaculum litoreum]|uniref:hypothetical protein n=1 Tax=Halobaculum litoreum TaxID=3031998 RepID=UPI002AA29D4A|nr:hypothetical protein [Halobaculum sp. DT92]